MANKTALIKIEGSNNTWMEIQVSLTETSGGGSMTWQRIGLITSRKWSFSGDYNTTNYPFFITFKDKEMGNVFQLSGFQKDTDTRFPFNDTSKGEGACLVGGFEVQQGSLTWKVVQILLGN